MKCANCGADHKINHECAAMCERYHCVHDRWAKVDIITKQEIENDIKRERQCGKK